MTDFIPSPEAVEAVEDAERNEVHPENRARAAIAAFVEAEGLIERGVEELMPYPEVKGFTRLVGPWRKRD